MKQKYSGWIICVSDSRLLNQYVLLLMKPSPLIQSEAPTLYFPGFHSSCSWCEFFSLMLPSEMWPRWTQTISVTPIMNLRLNPPLAHSSCSPAILHIEINQKIQMTYNVICGSRGILGSLCPNNSDHSLSFESSSLTFKVAGKTSLVQLYSQRFIIFCSVIKVFLETRYLLCKLCN